MCNAAVTAYQILTAETTAHETLTNLEQENAFDIRVEVVLLLFENGIRDLSDARIIFVL